MTEATAHTAALVRAVVDGDEEAFRQLYALLEPVARRSALRAARGLPQLDVDEAVNLALTRVWNALDTFQDDRELIPWAAVVIAHAVRSAARTCRSAKASMNWGAMLGPAVNPDRGSAEPLMQRVADQARTEDTILHRDSVDTISVLLDELLSEREAQVLRMRMAGWAYSEISEALGVNLKAVDNALRRAIQRLRRAFGTEEELVASLHEDSG